MGVSRSIGSLVVRIVADGLGAYKADLNEAEKTTTSATAKVEKSITGWELNMKGVAAEMSRTAETSQVLSKSAQDLVDRYDPVSATMRRLTEDMALARKEMGNSTSSAAFKVFQGLEEDMARVSAQATGKLGSIALSAKQTSNALRGVPAQFTDIVTSLQAGQSPIQVFLQQGGQLKDMFGGAGNAAKALGSYVVGLVNPFTVTAVAVAALGVAAYQGAQEQVGYQKALILTGNAAGTTSGQMADMARHIGDQAGTVHDAATALTAMAATGQVAGAMLEKAARTAAEEQRVLGNRVDDTAKRFAELGEDPVRASLKLNESMHYLTASTYAQIKAAQDLGDEDRAATLAQTAYADATLERLAQVTESLGYLETAWHGVRDAALKGWSATMGWGRPDDQIAAVQAKLDELTQKQARMNPVVGEMLNGQIDKLKEELAYRKHIAASEKDYAAAQADQTKREESSIALAEKADKFASKQVQMQREIAAAQNQLANSNLSAADYANYEQAVVGIANKFKEPEKSGPKGRAPAKEVDEAAKGVALYNDLVAKSNGFTANYAEQMHSLALAASKGALSVDEVARAVAMINSQQPGAVALAKAEEDALAAAIKTIEKNDELARSYDDARVAAAEYLDTLRLQAAREAGGVGRGTAYREDQSGLNNIEDKFTTKKAKLLRDSDKKGEYWYSQELALAQSTYDQEVEIYQKSVADKRAAQGDWVNGANEAMNNYMDNAANVAGSMESVFSDAFKGMEDAMVSFVTTGKLDFDSLATSIVSGITRIIIQQQMIKPMADYLQGGMSSGSGLGGLISSGLSSIFGGGSDPAGGANMTNLFADVIPKAATGGTVRAGSLTQVNEQGPELVSVGKKDYLMMGNQGGYVTPNNQISSGSGGRVQNNTVVNHFHLSGPVDKRTQSQMASGTGAAVQRALARDS